MIQEIAYIPQRLKKLRHHSQHEITDCAMLLEISVEAYEKYENGDAEPSLPEIELLSVLYNVPIEWFYQSDIHEFSSKSILDIKIKSKYKQLRNKVILAKLQIEREKKGFALKDLNSITGIQLETLQQYTQGKSPISIHHLIRISEALDQPISIFLDQEAIAQEYELKDSAQPQWEHENNNEEDKVDQKFEAFDDPLALAIKQMPVEEQAEIAKFILGKLKAQ